MSQAFALVLERLYERTHYAPRGSAGQKSARCPSHDDTRPSLSVGVGADGVVRLKCHGGPQCPTEDIVAALDLPMSALWPEELQGKQERRAEQDEWIPCRDRGHRKVAEYRYTDEQGAVLYGVTRCDKKCFSQWRPDHTKRHGRRWSLYGDDGKHAVRLVPYRLPDVIAAVREERVVWITEGEKDAEALRTRPLITATCNSGGAGKWQPDFAQYFHGADITIVADRDKPGRDHAVAVVGNLMPVARSIEVVQSVHGKDAADHFAGGGNTGDFVTVWEPLPFALGGEA